MMASVGVLGEYKGSQAREVMMTLEEYEQLRESMQTESDAQEQGGAESDAEVSGVRYEGSAEGEYHYAAVEEQD